MLKVLDLLIFKEIALYKLNLLLLLSLSLFLLFGNGIGKCIQPYTGGIPQQLDSDVHSVVTAKTIIHDADSNATALTMTAQVQQW